MIPFTSCIRFNQQQQQEWLVVQTRFCRAVQLEILPDKTLQIKFTGDEEKRKAEKSKLKSFDKYGVALSATDIALIQATLDVDDACKRSRNKFLTLQTRKKRTKAHVQSISLPSHISLLFDNIANNQTQFLMNRISLWNFNAFSLDVKTGGRSLPVLLFHLMDLYGLISHFQLETVKVWKCFSMIESGYHSNNPYHNSIHATDVTQAMHCFLQESKIINHLTPLEKMSALIAAVSHDLDHPGVNQPFLVATSNHLAALYKNASILENHHWRSAVSCILNSEVFSEMDGGDWELMVSQIQELILCTDITRHEEFLTTFKKHIIEDNLNLEDYNSRLFVLQIAMKCADISNPCRPWDISKKWSDKVCEEFFRQGDYERDLKLPVTSMCDRNKTPSSKVQTGFIKYVAAMLFDLWDQYHKTDLSRELVGNLRMNLKNWEEIYRNEKKLFCCDDSVSLEDDMDNGSTKSSPAEHSSLSSMSGSKSPDLEISLAMSKGRRYTLPLVLPHYLPITRVSHHDSVRSEIVGSSAGDVNDYAVVVNEDVEMECDKQQNLHHQPASFPPYYRLTRQIKISSHHNSCKNEAMSEHKQDHHYGSDTSSSSPGCPPRGCPGCESGPAATCENVGSYGNNDSSSDASNGGENNQQNKTRSDCVEESVLSDEESDCNFPFNVANIGCRPVNRCYRRGSEPVDLQKLKLFEIPYLELHPSLRNANAVNVHRSVRRGSMPTNFIERGCKIGGSSADSYKKPLIAFQCSSNGRQSFHHHEETYGGPPFPILAHISSSESETETNASVANMAEFESRCKKEPTYNRSAMPFGRRRSAPIVGASVRTNERLYAIYAAAALDPNKCQTIGQIFGSVWPNGGYLHHHGQMSDKELSGSMSSFQLHSNFYEQKNSGIDVCSQYVLSRGRRASAPVTFTSSSFVA